MKTLDVSIWRGDGRGSCQSYEVPCREEETVRDLVTRVQRKLDATLSDRFACRVGVCGSCAMTVDGKPRWTCRTLVRTVAKDGTLRIGPLDNMQVIKDLACDMTVFFEKRQAARGRFVPANPPPLEFSTIEPGSRPRGRN